MKYFFSYFKKLFKKTLKKKVFKTFIFSYSTFFYSLILSVFFISTYYYYNFSCQPDFFCKTSTFYQFIDHMHKKYFDLKLLFRSKSEKVSKEIVIVAVDDVSLDKVGRWPWKRDKISKIIEDIFKHHPKLLAFDMVFSEPSEDLKSEILSRLENSKNLKDKSLKSNVRKLIDEIKKNNPDEALARVIRKYRSKIVMGTFYEKENFLETFLGIKEDDSFLDLGFKNSVEQKNNKKGNSANHFMANEERFLSVFDPYQNSDLNIMNPILEVSQWVKNISLLSSVTQNTGFFNAELDLDGLIRRSRLFVRSSYFYVPSLAFKSFLVFKEYNGELSFERLKLGRENRVRKVFKTRENLKNLEIKKNGRLFKKIESLNIIDLKNGNELFKVPLDLEGQMLINYVSSDDFYTVSALEFLNQNQKIRVKKEIKSKNKTFIQEALYEKSQFLKDKILIFGVTAKAVFDMRSTPVHKNYPGVKVHAHILSNLLKNRFLFSLSGEKVFSFWFLVFLIFFMSFCFQFLNAKGSLFLFFVSFSSLGFFDFLIFFKKGLHLSFLLPFFFLILEYIGFILIKYLVEEAEKRKLKNKFSRYVSPFVFKEIISAPEKVKFKGREEHITVFLSDIRNFSQLSEKMRPSFLNEWLSVYFTSMTEIILKYRGTLDKYIGDAILSFFGAPLKDSFHVKNACLSALCQLEKMKELRKVFLRKKWPTFNIGIALNSGSCYVGDIGSKDLRNYTVLGKTVNLTSRIEKLNKYYGTNILITKETHQFIEKDFLCREIDFLKIEGKKTPIPVFELLGQQKTKQNLKFRDSTFIHSDWLKSYNKAYEMFRKRNFKLAKKYFLKVLKQKANDLVSKIYLKRCNEFIKNPSLIKNPNQIYRFRKS